MMPLTKSVAVLYQGLSAPVIDGVRKPMKQGGYSDSGADIAFVLRHAGVQVVTPVTSPDPRNALDWVFPDTQEGIESALTQGADVLWANTVLFENHPLSAVKPRCLIVGQQPESVQQFDDKWLTNVLLEKADIPIPRNLILTKEPSLTERSLPLAGLSTRALAHRHLSFPLVLKPLRGRGSQGVSKVDDLESLCREAEQLFAAHSDEGDSTFGVRLMIEEYLAGQEITITVMPPGTYTRDGSDVIEPSHWTLPPVVRINHHNGIAPYNGEVAVVENSYAMNKAEQETPEVQSTLKACALAGNLLAVRAPIRIDCRQNSRGAYRIFDVNMKPNMTGNGRPGRENQDSLVALAAREIGWSFTDLLLNMLRQAW